MLAKWLVVLVLCITLGGASAVERGPEPSRTVNIIVRQAGEGVDVTYRVSEPVITLTFDQPNIIFRGPSWQVQDAPDLIISKGVVRSISGRPFQQFTLHIKPDTTMADDGSFSLMPIGDHGVLLYIHALMADAREAVSIMCIQDTVSACANMKESVAYFDIKTSGYTDA